MTPLPFFDETNWQMKCLLDPHRLIFIRSVQASREPGSTGQTLRMVNGVDLEAGEVELPGVVR